MMPFEASTLSTATVGIFTGGSFTDTFVVGFSDVDMVALDLVEGRSYEIDVDNGTAGDFYLRIFDQFGIEVKANDDGNFSGDNTVFSLSPYTQFTPNYSGRYYVAISPYYLDTYDPTTLVGRVSPENPLTTTAGTLTIQDLGQKLWSSAGAINSITAEGSSDSTDVLADTDRTVRVEFLGAVDSPADVDITRIDIAKGDVLVIDVNGELPSGTTATVLRVFDDTGLQIGFDDDAGIGDDPELIFAAPNLDDYYIGISGDGNSSYNPVDGTGTVAATVGSYEVIVHRNPTQIGSSFANIIDGDDAANYIVSLGGNDTLTGGDGNDTLAGGDDQDSLSGGNGRDQLYGEHGDDTLLGDAGSDVLSGGLGNDSLDGGFAADVLTGGFGNDTLNGGAGTFGDTLSGGDGTDTLLGGSGDDSLSGDTGDDSLNGATQNDTLLGGDGNDTLLGGGNDDNLDGETGNDSLNGGTGTDILNGGSGDDTLSGAGGNDRLVGGLGNDTLIGGQNDDAFVFASTGEGVDILTDFILASADVIDLAALFGPGVVNAGNLSQFIQTSTSGISDSFLAVDANGLTGGLSFTIIAQVTGVTAVQLFDVTNFLL